MQDAIAKSKDLLLNRHTGGECQISLDFGNAQLAHTCVGNHFVSLVCRIKHDGDGLFVGQLDVLVNTDITRCCSHVCTNTGHSEL